MISEALVGGVLFSLLLLIGAVGLWRSRGGGAWSYVLFACVGLLPLPGFLLGESLLRLEGPRGIQFFILLYAAALATGVLLSLLSGRGGESRGAFVARGVAVSLAALVLASGGGPPRLQHHDGRRCVGPRREGDAAVPDESGVADPGGP